MLPLPVLRALLISTTHGDNLPFLKKKICLSLTDLKSEKAKAFLL